MATVLGKFTKQSGETLDYYVDFTDWFSNRSDAPASHTATADAGITVTTSSLSGNKVKVVLSGGTNGTKYKVTVKLTTNSTPAIVKEADFLVTVKDV
jgi:hypothetical protein